MNKKQREAKRKNAQAHQKKVRELFLQREEARLAYGPVPLRRLYRAGRVIHTHAFSPAIDQVLLSHGLVGVDTLIPLATRRAIADGLERSPKEHEVMLAIADLCLKENKHGEE